MLVVGQTKFRPPPPPKFLGPYAYDSITFNFAEFLASTKKSCLGGNNNRLSNITHYKIQKTDDVLFSPRTKALKGSH